MDAFTTLTGIAAPLPLANVDTDKIIPARFLKTIKRTGLGVHLFDTLRYDAEGSERPEFVLNQEPYRRAEILIAHENFGCGSSREHAPIAIKGAGVSVVIAKSFARIFYRNAFNTGLPILVAPRNTASATPPILVWTSPASRSPMRRPSTSATTGTRSAAICWTPGWRCSCSTPQ